MIEVKPIVITDTESGEKYTLEFDKESIKFAERNGFNLDDLGRFPVTKIEELFWYAFRKNHKRVDRIKAEKLLKGIGRPLPEDFVERLALLYANRLEAFTESEEEVTPFVTVE